MKKVFHARKIRPLGWYSIEGSLGRHPLMICKEGLREFFYAGKGLPDFHVQTTKPAGDNYHTLRLYRRDYWEFVDAAKDSDGDYPCPLAKAADYLLMEQFPRSKTLYVSVYAE